MIEADTWDVPLRALLAYMISDKGYLMFGWCQTTNSNNDFNLMFIQSISIIAGQNITLISSPNKPYLKPACFQFVSEINIYTYIIYYK